jgi:hypothetical protein
MPEPENDFIGGLKTELTVIRHLAEQAEAERETWASRVQLYDFAAAAIERLLFAVEPEPEPPEKDPYIIGAYRNAVLQ